MEQFKKLKKRLLTEAVVKSAICGVSAALFAVGAVLLGLKLAQIEINAGYYVLIGVLSAGLVGGGLFLFLRLNDKKLAKLLDEKHGLHERIQTLVAFDGKEGAFLELQRKDALEKLAALPKHKLEIKKLWQYIVIPVLALALFITAVALPYDRYEPVEPDPPFTYDARQKAAVELLISDVESSSLTDAETEAVTTMLTVMSEALEEAEKVSQMKSAVFAAVSFIDTLLYTSNSFDNVAYAIGGDNSEVTEFISAAINDGALFYKVGSSAITSIEQVRSLESGILNSIGETVDADVDVFLQQYNIKISDGLQEKLNELTENLQIASDDAVAAEEDGIRQSIENFAAALAEISENISSYTDSAVQSAISKIVATFKDELVEALVPQSYRCIMDEFVRQRLAQIFGISADELPSQNSGVQELDSAKDDEDGTQGGGAGKGETVYGSNELVYDPDTDEYVPYGTYFDKYYASITEQLLSGALAENLQDYIRNYFGILYSGTDYSEEN